MTLVRNRPGVGARPGLPDLAAEHQRYLVRAAEVEVVADDAFEEGPPGGGPLEHPGVGDLELAERQLVDIPGAQVSGGEGGRQPVKPAPEEAGHRAGAKPVADPLQNPVGRRFRH
jgi:hypothetical protein